jgi:hypothetical protein
MPQGTADKKEPPLKIAVKDMVGSSPFLIAVMRGHLDAAKVIAEICKAQYVPKEVTKERYSMAQEDGEYDSNDDSEGSSNELNVQTEIMNDTFTIDNIGEVSLQVKSDVSPSTMIQWKCGLTRFISGGAITLTDSQKNAVTRHLSGGSHSLFAFAITKDDLKLLNLLLDLGCRHSSRIEEDSEVASGFFSFSPEDFNLAIELGRTQHLSSILLKTGAGIPLDDLVKKEGILVKEKPKYYQGLTVHGKKNATWAAAGRDLHVEKTGHKTSPLLLAAKFGSIESVEFFLSDTPLRHYSEFAKANQDDKRLKNLSLSPGGFEKAISKWLYARSKLLSNYQSSLSNIV